MLRTLRAVLLAGAAAGSISTAAFAAVDQPVSQANALIQSGRPQQAYALLAPLAAQRAGDPDFDYALGLAAVDSGKPAEAIIALQRVLAVQPQNAPARAELARAYAVAGDVDTAKREFDTVVADPTLPDPVRQRFFGILSDLDRTIAGGGSDVSGYIEAGAGYDGNINTATSATSLVIPLFAGLGPAALSGTATANEDSFARLEGGVSVVHGLSRQTRVFASLLGSWKENIDDDVFDQASLTGSAGLSYTLPSRIVLAGSLQAQGFWLGGDRYRDTLGGSAQVTIPSGGDALTFSAQYFDLSYPDPVNAPRDGQRYAVGASYVWRFGVLAAQYGKEEADAAASAQINNTFGGVSVAFEAPLAPNFTAVASLATEQRRYDEAPDPLFLAFRKDRQFDAVLSLRWRISQRLTVRPQVTYTDNSSNIALYEYDRLTASVSLRSEF